MNKLTSKQQKQFREVKLCHICNQDLPKYIYTAKDMISHLINKIQFYIRLEINNKVRTLINGALKMESFLLNRMRELRPTIRDLFKNCSKEELEQIVAEIDKLLMQYRASYQKYIRENNISIVTTREIKKIKISKKIENSAEMTVLWKNVDRVFQNGKEVENPHILNNSVPLVIKQCILFIVKVLGEIKDENEDAEDPRVRDHCYITGKYRGVSHRSCNLKLRLSKTIPVIFHNLRGYDSHLIIKEFQDRDAKIKCTEQ